MAKLQPFLARDFRLGRYTPSQVSDFLAPENSVKHSLNVNFDTIVGLGAVRLGTSPLMVTSGTGARWSDWTAVTWLDRTTTTWADTQVLTPTSAVDSGRVPLGLGEFVGFNSTPNLLLVVFQGDTIAHLYYFDTAWHLSTVVFTSNTTKHRFATFGGRAIETDSVDGMKSSSDGNTWSAGAANDCLTTGEAKPSILFRYKSRMLASGDSTYPDRVWFSSIISPAASPFITWDANTTTGDWIDVNPDDGGNVAGFSITSTFLLIFKNNGMYRLDVVSKQVDPDPIFDVGAVSQEAIATCQGVTYFYSGNGVYRTDGGYPELISRAGIQDIIDAVPNSRWQNVALGSDGFNVYVSVGSVTLQTNQDTQTTINNCVCKFSVRDQSWSVHSYAQQPRFFSQYTDLNGRMLRWADTSGNVQTINITNLDNGSAINYYLETQDLEFGNKSQLHQLSDKIVVYTKNGMDGSIKIRVDDKVDLLPVLITLSKRVAISKDIQVQGYSFNIIWEGLSTGTPPVFEGYNLIGVSEVGIV